MKVSIIVPVYNVEKYLGRCIDSILAQTYADFECILVDDGSRDASPDICRAYAEKDARARVIVQENKGASGARNTGLQAAEGDYVAFVDCDDHIDAKAIETLVGITECDHADLAVMLVLWDGIRAQFE